MRKLEIDYDFIDKIYESEGKYKLKRYIIKNKINDVIIAGVVTEDIVLGVVGKTTPEQTAYNIGTYLVAVSSLLLFLETIHERIKRNITGMTKEERAEEELRELTVQLNNLNINVNLDNIKESNVYHKKYRLRKDGKPGIIRERYIEIPLDDNKYNFNEDSVSIKEEHAMGTRSYVLTLGKPPKEMVYKPAFNM